jgi:hypothetical protein
MGGLGRTGWHRDILPLPHNSLISLNSILPPFTPEYLAWVAKTTSQLSPYVQVFPYDSDGLRRWEVRASLSSAVTFARALRRMGSPRRAPA